jgi:hypothetical protein
MNFTLKKLIFLWGLLLIVPAAVALPITYHFDDAGGPIGPAVGAGVFTLDLETEFGTYIATDVSGGPGTAVGAWSDVRFLASPDSASLAFNLPNPPGFTYGVSAEATGKENWATAMEAWSDFQTHLADLGVFLAPVAVPPARVPDSASTRFLLLSSLAGLFFARSFVKEIGR